MSGHSRRLLLFAGAWAGCPFSGNAAGPCPRLRARSSEPVGAEETVPPSERGRQLEGFPAHLDPYSGPGLLNAGKAS